jgi:hypothetical protein
VPPANATTPREGSKISRVSAPEEQFLERRSAFSRLCHAHENGVDDEYRPSAHVVYDLKYHLIRCMKYRYKILRGRVAEQARDLIRQICRAREVVIVRGAVSPDHIHMLLAAPPVIAPAKLAQ